MGHHDPRLLVLRGRVREGRGQLADQAHRIPARVRGDPAARQRRRPEAHRVVVGHRRPQRASCRITRRGRARVDPALVEQFRRDGFVVVDGLLTDAELDRYEPLVTDAVATRKRDAPPLDERRAYEQSFHQCINLWEDYPAIRPLTFHPRIGQAAAELLGVDARAAVARPGAVQGSRRPRDRRAPGPAVLADRRDRRRSPRGSRSTVDARERRDGLPPGSHASACASSSTSSRRGPAVLMDQPEIRAHRAGLRRGAEGLGRVPPRPHRAHGEAEHHRRRPRRAHDHLHRRRLHAPQRQLALLASTATASRSARRSTARCTPIVWPRPDGRPPRSPAAASGGHPQHRGRGHAARAERG